MADFWTCNKSACTTCKTIIMKTKKEIFNLIKKTVNLPGEINDYQLRLSDSRFERENLMGIYRIRKGIATRQENFKLADQMSLLLTGLENDMGFIKRCKYL